ncbi:hypothetical protein CWI37_0058p0020 [Hamiltosporidium tvaerminnensis]|uniref:Uncharacterized protein n=1 Tax=Hamiltosporidium tvaerminnensis TaxID=1176355 RepID=A0A4Q9LBU2_9MICR|nr:hypothetical protein CWI37_0058p0020 [Hamiltosporidium tvaerminnensis]
MCKNTERGILQKIALAIVVCLCMDPLNRILNVKYTKGTIHFDVDSGCTIIHFLSIILGPSLTDSSTLGAMPDEIDKDRSATYRVFCEDTDTLIEGVSVCDYLEIIEDSNSNPTLSSFDEIKRLITRVERLFELD